MKDIKKIRFTVPYFIKEKIKEDEVHFNLLSGEIGNRILKYYSNKTINKINIKSDKGEIIQFNLNKFNTDLYDVILKEHCVQNEAEFFRELFFKYLNNLRYIREKILFSNIFKEVNLAIKEGKKLNIKYNNEIRTISPYFIKADKGEDRSYIFCYCEKNENYRNYRVANIQRISLSKNDLEIKDKKYIDDIEKNFDPFLSFGKKVVAKVNKIGEIKYKKAILNRPKVIDKNKDIWTFQCDTKLAKIYFPQFLDNIEIIEPIELREWFINNFQNVLNIYGSRDE